MKPTLQEARVVAVVMLTMAFGMTWDSFGYRAAFAGVLWLVAATHMIRVQIMMFRGKEES